ncbi:hypothetical protein KCP76_23210 [Salmonella enterica subsp. enterica serovar Weltevreden]|nr:hypothetical protein KCP76_23210 [Salmonella enterica subsp. enterica serovar Weltevreden]
MLMIRCSVIAFTFLARSRCRHHQRGALINARVAIAVMVFIMNSCD